MTFGLVVGNRGFFPDHLANSGREEMTAVLTKAGYKVVALGPQDTKCGAVTTREDSKKLADLFKKHREEIDGIILTLPNFGEESAIADGLQLAGLDVPVLVQATPDESSKMSIAFRRDSFCGKMSACNNLKQIGIKFSLTTLHTEAPDSPEFAKDLEWFAAVCRVVGGFKNLRVGAIGARPAAFRTVRYSEKIYAANGITVETLDLSEVLGRISRLKDDDKLVQEKLAGLKGYVPTGDVTASALLKMAKLAAVIETWCQEVEVDITTIQCWTSLEENLGIVPCAVMSMLSDSLRSSACEVDVPGLLGMHALRLASGSPSALLDWNNNYNNDPDKCVTFHCSNLPKSFFKEAKMDYQEIIAGTVGKLNTFGTVVGTIKPGDITFARFSTDDVNGSIHGFIGEGCFTEDPLDTFGGAGVLKINNLQKLLRVICEQGYEHHVAANFTKSAAALKEAATNYFGWSDIYMHE
jgi:L-fucose isomerase-like protein